MSLKRTITILAICYGGIAIVPIFFGDMLFIMRILIMCLIWSVVAACWDLIMGFAGIFSFGQLAFFVMGAYSSAILSIRLGIPPVFAMLLAGGVATGIGVIVGLVCLRLKGAYVALVTYAVYLIMEPFIRSEWGKALGTGAGRGIMAIPPLNILGVTFGGEDLVPFFYLTLFVSIVCAGVILLVIKSYWGTAFLALKDSEDFSAALGVSAFKYKLMVFALTSFITGMIGGFYAHYIGMLSTRSLLGTDVFLSLLIMLVIGGTGKFPGAIIGAFIMVTLNEVLAPLGSYRLLTLGAMVVVLVLFLPGGIMGLIEKIPSPKTHQ